MSFQLKKTFRFEAAHQLPRHDGKCARLHGHSFVMHIYVGGDVLHDHGPKAGMVQDFSDISRIVKPLVEDKLDHHFLNESTGLPNPTSECLAVWIYHALVERGLPDLVAVEIEETCTSSCLFKLV